MRNGGHWNRQGRRSGGYKPPVVPIPRPGMGDAETLRQAREIHLQFGRNGLAKFWAAMEAKVLRETPGATAETAKAAVGLLRDLYEGMWPA